MFQNDKIKKMQKNRFGISKKNIEFLKKSFGKKNTRKKGFVILIAIVVSSLIVSMGIFISTVAYKELVLSTSAKSSQKAFYIADSVLECALRADVRDLIFDDSSINGKRANDIGFTCNKKVFKGEVDDGSPKITYRCKSDTGPGPEENCYSGKFVYFVSFAESGLNPITNAAPETNPNDSVKNAAYAKVVFEKNHIGDLGYQSLSAVPETTTCYDKSKLCKDETIIKVYAHNKHSGIGLVERALEAQY